MMEKTEIIAIFDHGWEKISSNSAYDTLSADELIEAAKASIETFDEPSCFEAVVEDPEKEKITYHISLTPLKTGDDEKNEDLLLLHGYDLHQIKAMEDDLAESRESPG